MHVEAKRLARAPETEDKAIPVRLASRSRPFPWDRCLPTGNSAQTCRESYNTRHLKTLPCLMHLVEVGLLPPAKLSVQQLARNCLACH